MSRLIPNLVFLDFETSGLASKSDDVSKRKLSDPKVVAVTQISFLIVDGVKFEEKAKFNNYIYPYDKTLEYQVGALEFTGISVQKLYDKGITLQDAVKGMAKILMDSGEGRYSNILVGQNILFDIDFLHDIFKRTRTNLKKCFYGAEIGGVFIPDYLDTINQSKMAFPEAKSHSMRAICENVEVDYVDGHDSWNDVLITLDVFKALVGRIRSKGGGEEGGEILRNRDSFEI